MLLTKHIIMQKLYLLTKNNLLSIYDDIENMKNSNFELKMWNILNAFKFFEHEESQPLSSSHITHSILKS